MKYRILYIVLFSILSNLLLAQTKDVTLPATTNVQGRVIIGGVYGLSMPNISNLYLGGAGNFNLTQYNVGAGRYALQYLTTGIGNTAFGYSANRRNATGNYTAWFGYNAGNNNTFANQSYIGGIDVSDTTCPLIYFDFYNNVVDICGNLYVNGSIMGPDSNLWYLNLDTIINKNNHKVYLTDSVYFNRDAIPFLDVGDPLAGVLTLRKLPGELRQLAMISMLAFADSLSYSGGGIWAIDSVNQKVWLIDSLFSVGIGTSTPNGALDVIGLAQADELAVQDVNARGLSFIPTLQFQIDNTFDGYTTFRHELSNYGDYPLTLYNGDTNTWYNTYIFSKDSLAYLHQDGSIAFKIDSVGHITAPNLVNDTALNILYYNSDGSFSYGIQQITQKDSSYVTITTDTIIPYTSYEQHIEYLYENPDNGSGQAQPSDGTSVMVFKTGQVPGNVGDTIYIEWADPAYDKCVITNVEYTELGTPRTIFTHTPANSMFIYDIVNIRIQSPINPPVYVNGNLEILGNTTTGDTADFQTYLNLPPYPDSVTYSDTADYALDSDKLDGQTGTYYLDNTDNQSLTYNKSTGIMSISGGTGDTINNFSATWRGLVPQSGGGTTNYMRADGTWVEPPGTAVADNLGNHTMIKNLITGPYFISKYGTQSESGISFTDEDWNKNLINIWGNIDLGPKPASYYQYIEWIGYYNNDGTTGSGDKKGFSVTSSNYPRFSDIIDGDNEDYLLTYRIADSTVYGKAINAYLETEVDGDISNEGKLSVTTGSGTSSVIHSNTSGSTDVTINVAGINSISETTSSMTITATEVDGVIGNEGDTTAHLTGDYGIIGTYYNQTTDVEWDLDTTQIRPWIGSIVIDSTIGDNLGNHTADTSLNMSNDNIYGIDTTNTSELIVQSDFFLENPNGWSATNSRDTTANKLLGWNDNTVGGHNGQVFTVPWLTAADSIGNHLNTLGMYFNDLQDVTWVGADQGDIPMMNETNQLIPYTPNWLTSVDSSLYATIHYVNSSIIASGGYLWSVNVATKTGYLTDTTYKIGVGTTHADAMLHVDGGVFVKGGSGDFDGDGEVFAGDLTYFLNNWGTPDSITSERFARLDLSGDGVLNFDDCNILISLYPDFTPNDNEEDSIRLAKRVIMGSQWGMWSDSIFDIRAALRLSPDSVSQSLITGLLGIGNNREVKKIAIADLSGEINADTSNWALDADKLDGQHGNYYLDNTDAQDLSLSVNTLSLTGDATSVDLSGYLDNTDAQDLTIAGNVLSLSGDATTVTLPTYDITEFVDTTGTPAATQLAIFTDGNSIKGDTTLTLTTTSLIFSKAAAQTTISIVNESTGTLGACFALIDQAGTGSSFKITASNGTPDLFKFRDVGGAKDAFVIEENSINNAIYIKAGGNVGISSNNPGYKLDVAGDINTSGDYRKAGAIVPVGYSLQFNAYAPLDPADNANIYIGGAVASTTDGVYEVVVPKSGVIKTAYVRIYIAGVAGTNESIAAHVRINTNSNASIGTVSSTAVERIISNAAMSTSVTAGDYLQIYIDSPTTWATNPTSVIFGGTIYIE